MTDPRQSPEPAANPQPGTAAYAGRVIQEARLNRRPPWPQSRLIIEMRQVAAAHGHSLPGPTSLRKMLSRWENGHAAPGGFNRQVLAEALGISVAELRLPTDGTAYTPLHS